MSPLAPSPSYMIIFGYVDFVSSLTSQFIQSNIKSLAMMKGDRVVQGVGHNREETVPSSTLGSYPPLQQETSEP